MIHPVLKASLIGTCAMSIVSALIGTFVFLRKRSLIGETLSHAAFPGILAGALILSSWMLLGMTLGGLIFSLMGLKCVDWMEKKGRVKSDAALTFVLATFMGWGVLLASILQKFSPLGYRQSLLFLYGQAATMTSFQSWLYVAFALSFIVFLLLFYPRLKLINFDPQFAESIGIRLKPLETVSFLLIVFTIILGIRSIGVVLMAGMLIAPAASARPWTHRFSFMLLIASGFGLVSALLGNFLSFKLSSPHFSLPTGPMILLSSSFLCFLSLLIAPKSGLLVRLVRMQIFRLRCKIENGLKLTWKKPELFSELPFLIRSALRLNHWVGPHGKITPLGEHKAKKIVRLHRLWEVYLVEYLGQNVDKVHRTAEELEHLFSPALEQELTRLLGNPIHDPHQQPIPPGDSP